MKVSEWMNPREKVPVVEPTFEMTDAFVRKRFTNSKQASDVITASSLPSGSQQEASDDGW